ncbi:MAG: transporter permease [Haloplasmataceae bacterium]|jgi:multiple sugar transport system permease protein|nr:transporter permease [Haloplasmataceae bacterium]
MKNKFEVKSIIKRLVSPIEQFFSPLSKKLNKINREISEKYNNSKYVRIFNHPVFFILPYIVLFSLIILLPTIISAALSLTYYNTIQFPDFIYLENYINLLTNDSVFLQSAIANTIKWGVIVGPAGYILSFFLAWLLSQVTHRMRTIYTLCIYSPSITGPIMMSVLWRVIFSGDQSGYINYVLLKLGLITNPIVFLQDPNLLFIIMVLIALWSSAGIGFLAMIAGMLNIDRTLYEAAYIDGIKNRWQEIFYITIPSMKPQMLFGAVMAIVGSFNVSGIASALSGGNPPPQYVGWMIMDHANDYGFIRYEMGYASAVAIILLVIVFVFNKVSYKLFGNNE